MIYKIIAVAVTSQGLLTRKTTLPLLCVLFLLFMAHAAFVRIKLMMMIVLVDLWTCCEYKS